MRQFGVTQRGQRAGESAITNGTDRAGPVMLAKVLGGDGEDADADDRRETPKTQVRSHQVSCFRRRVDGFVGVADGLSTDFDAPARRSGPAM